MLKLFEEKSVYPDILVYIATRGQLEFMENLFAKNPDFRFTLLFSHTFETLDFFNQGLLKYTNILATKDINNIFFKMKHFGCLLTFETNATHAHRRGLFLSFLASLLSIPVIEIQHGLFQLGIHYESVLPHFETYISDSFSVRGYANHTLTFYPSSNIPNSTCIGYPRYISNKKTVYKGNYGLILTNLHWNTYKEETRMFFYHLIVKTAESFPEITFIWRNHPGEKEYIKRLETFINIRNIKNIILNKHNMTFIPTDELIKKAQFVISTPSTVLLDCERFEKPTYLFKSKTTECLTNLLKEKEVFSTQEELFTFISQKNFSSNFRSGFLYPFDNNKFRQVIKTQYQKTSLSDMEVLQKIYTVFPLINTW